MTTEIILDCNYTEMRVFVTKSHGLDHPRLTKAWITRENVPASSPAIYHCVSHEDKIHRSYPSMSYSLNSLRNAKTIVEIHPARWMEFNEKIKKYTKKYTIKSK